jgi:hypothetical protein
MCLGTQVCRQSRSSAVMPCTARFPLHSLRVSSIRASNFLQKATRRFPCPHPVPGVALVTLVEELHQFSFLFRGVFRCGRGPRHRIALYIVSSCEQPGAPAAFSSGSPQPVLLSIISSSDASSPMQSFSRVWDASPATRAGAPPGGFLDFGVFLCLGMTQAQGTGVCIVLKGRGK